jgi:hypothetical protein
MFGWGYSGAGPHLLYQALVHAMDGSVAPATDGRFIDEPSSFYRRLTARQHTPDVNDVVDEALVLQPDFVMSLVGCPQAGAATS